MFTSNSSGDLCYCKKRYGPRVCALFSSTKVAIASLKNSLCSLSYADDLKSIGRYSTVGLSHRQILYRFHRSDRQVLSGDPQKKKHTCRKIQPAESNMPIAFPAAIFGLVIVSWIPSFGVCNADLAVQSVCYTVQ